MTAQILPPGPAALLDLLERLLLTHGLDPAPFAAALGLPASALTAGSASAEPLGPPEIELLPLLVNVLLRLERRAGHEPRAVRRLLAQSLEALGGAAPADLLGGGEAALRTVRAALSGDGPPEERWWRVGHR